jgi:pyruvate dehydrogenase E2 component (dihydrolipoamide acetyltransferase)
VSLQKIVVPDIGGAEGAEVIELLVAVGDEVAIDQSLIVLESDKASMEIPSTAAGKVVEMLVAEGDELAEGAPVLVLEISGESSDAAAEPAAAEEVVDTTPVVTPAPDAQPAAPVVIEKPAPSVASSPERVDPPATHTEDNAEIYAGPAVRKLAREFGVTLSQVSGTGPSNRILKEDLQQFVQRTLQSPAAGSAAGAGIPAVPETDFAKFGDIETTQRSKLDKLTAKNMHRNWLNVPHVTQFDNADITDLEEFRGGMKAEAERRGTRLTPLPFLLKACAVALRDNPKINSSLSNAGEDLVFKKYIHIGMAVDTPAGLVVPVIRDADKKSIWELAEAVLELAGKARERKLMPADMQGGCFTISSLGNIGGTGFTPIVNTPEVAILGVSKAAIQPVWNGTEFAPRKQLPLALSYDHRVVNGGDGGRFLSRVVELLSDIRMLSL